MGDQPEFNSSFSQEAVSFIISLSKRNQFRVLDIADRIADWPEGIADVVLLDSKNRKIHSVLVDEFVFSYFIDHATKEVLITEVIQV